MTWKLTQNSWQYTSIYGADGQRICLLDLEDWGVTEDNQDALEKQQADIAWLIVVAPELLEAIIQCRKQIDTIIEDGTPTDWRMWRDDLDALIAKAGAA